MPDSSTGLSTAVQIPSLGAVHVRKLSEVRPAPDNPRKIPKRAVEVVARSLQEFGWQQPLVVDGDGVLIVGHTRSQAAKFLGLTEAPVVVAENLTPEQVRAYRIADNRTHDFTTWDLPMLVGQLDVLSDEFSEVLNLQDWATLVDDFKDFVPDVSDEVKANASVSGFVVSVVFASEEAALAQEQTIIDMPGTLDVRHPRG